MFIWLQIDCVTGQKETYASLLSRSIRTAQSIQAKGLVKGDVMSLCSFNNMDYSATIIASYFLGVHMSPFDPTAPLRKYITLFCLYRTHNPILLAASWKSYSPVSLLKILYSWQHPENPILLAASWKSYSPGNFLKILLSWELTENHRHTSSWCLLLIQNNLLQLISYIA